MYVCMIISKTLKPSLQCAKAAKKADQILGQFVLLIYYYQCFMFRFWLSSFPSYKKHAFMSQFRNASEGKYPAILCSFSM